MSIDNYFLYTTKVRYIQDIPVLDIDMNMFDGGKGMNMFDGGKDMYSCIDIIIDKLHQDDI